MQRIAVIPLPANPLAEWVFGVQSEPANRIGAKGFRFPVTQSVCFVREAKMLPCKNR